MKEIRYSVIIPVYKAEKTLRRCVDSLLNQNYSDMELILVNDGSPDGSGAICEEYAGRYPCVVYIDKPNGGVSSARNAGLEVAAGKYVLFVDSDDAVSGDYFSVLDLLDGEGVADFLWFSFAQEQEDGSYPRHLKTRTAEDRKDCTSLLTQALCDKTINPPWNKRYKNQLIQENKLRFPEYLSIGEDRLFNLQYGLLCGSCRVSDRVLYHVYMENLHSLSRKIRNDWETQLSRLDGEILETIHSAQIEDWQREAYLTSVNYMKLRAIYSEAKRMHLLGWETARRREKLRSMCEEMTYTPLPDTRSCRILCIPSRMKWVSLIDWIGKHLAGK